MFRKRNRELVSLHFLWQKVAASFSIFSRTVAFVYALAIGAVAARVVLPALLRTAILSFIFSDIVLIKHFAAMS